MIPVRNIKRNDRRDRDVINITKNKVCFMIEKRFLTG